MTIRILAICIMSLISVSCDIPIDFISNGVVLTTAKLRADEGDLVVVRSTINDRVYITYGDNLVSGDSVSIYQHGSNAFMSRRIDNKHERRRGNNE